MIQVAVVGNKRAVVTFSSELWSEKNTFFFALRKRNQTILSRELSRTMKRKHIFFLRAYIVCSHIWRVKRVGGQICLGRGTRQQFHFEAKTTERQNKIKHSKSRSKNPLRPGRSASEASLPNFCESGLPMFYFRSCRCVGRSLNYSCPSAAAAVTVAVRFRSPHHSEKRETNSGEEAERRWGGAECCQFFRLGKVGGVLTVD